MFLELVLDDLDYTLCGVRLASGRNLRPQVDKLRTRTSPEGGTIAGLPRGARTLVVVVRRDNRRETSSPSAAGDTDGDVQDVVIRIAGSKVNLLTTPNVNVRRPDHRDARRTIAVAVRRDGTSVRALRLGLLRRRRVRAHVVVPRATIRGADVDLFLVTAIVAVDVIAIANHDHATVVVHLNADASGGRHHLTVTTVLCRRVVLVDAVAVAVLHLTRRTIVRLSRRRRGCERSTLHRDGVLDIRADLRRQTLRGNLDTTGDRTNLDTTRDLGNHLDLDLLPRRTNDRFLGRLRLPEGEGEGLGLGDATHRRLLATLPKERVRAVRLPLDGNRLGLGDLEGDRPGCYRLPVHVTRSDDVTGERIAGAVVLGLAENGGAPLDVRDLGLCHLVRGQAVVACQAVLNLGVVCRKLRDATLGGLGTGTEALREDLGVARRVGGGDHRSDREDREERDQNDAQQLSHLRSPSFHVVRDQEELPDHVVGLATTHVSHTALPP